MSITPIYGTKPVLMCAAFTHTDGDANESLAIVGKPIGIQVCENTSTGPVEVTIKWSASISGRVTTITIYCNATVSDGYMVLTYIPE